MLWHVQKLQTGFLVRDVQRRGGGFVVLDSTSLAPVYTDPKPPGSVSDVKYSIEGSMLVVASSDLKIYLHSIPRGYAVMHALSGVMIPLNCKAA